MSVTEASNISETKSKHPGSLDSKGAAKVHAPKKVLMETWGCQMNVADSERMLQLLQAQNYQVTGDANEADLIVLNTCHIREKSSA